MWTVTASRIDNTHPDLESFWNLMVDNKRWIFALLSEPILNATNVRYCKIRTDATKSTLKAPDA